MAKPRIAQPVPLPTCEGPDCRHPITFRSPSPWFHSELCQRSWQVRQQQAQPRR